MKKLIFSLALVALVAVLDNTFSLSLPIECYVASCFFLGASVLELTRQSSKAEKCSKKENVLGVAV